MDIEYRSFRDLPGYKLGNDGSCWTNKIPGMRGQTGDEWREMKASSCWRNKRYRKIRLKHKGKEYDIPLHRAILEAFVGPCPDGMEGMHLDGNPSNNAISNLRWGSKSENMSHKAIHGTETLGEKHGRSKLKEQDVREIRRLCSIGFSQYEVAKKFKVKQPLVSRIVAKLLWCNLL